MQHPDEKLSYDLSLPLEPTLTNEQLFAQSTRQESSDAQLAAALQQLLTAKSKLKQMIVHSRFMTDAAAKMYCEAEHTARERIDKSEAEVAAAMDLVTRLFANS